MPKITVLDYLALPEDERPPVRYQGEWVSRVYRDPTYLRMNYYVIRTGDVGHGSKPADTQLEIDRGMEGVIAFVSGDVVYAIVDEEPWPTVYVARNGHRFELIGDVDVGVPADTPLEVQDYLWGTREEENQ